MAKHPHCTLRIIWKEDRKETFCDVFAPIILLNLRMVDLRLRTAGLHEITPLIVDAAVGCTSKHAASVFQNAYEFYKANPDSIPFSDMLEETLPHVAAVLASISPRVRVRFETNDLKEAQVFGALSAAEGLIGDVLEEAASRKLLIVERFVANVGFERGAADRVVPEVSVDWRRPGQRNRSVVKHLSLMGPRTRNV